MGLLYLPKAFARSRESAFISDYRRVTIGLQALVGLSLVYGCEGALENRSARSESDERDAFALVIEYEALSENLPVWSARGDPTFRIGALEGAGPDVFAAIASVALRSDGGVIVADRLNLELRAFGVSGEHEWTAGGAGQGPGEFVSLTFVGVLEGDAIVAFGETGTGHLFDADGTFARQIVLESLPFPPYGTPRIVGVTRDGFLIGQSTIVQSTSEVLGYFRPELVFVVYDLTGSLVYLSSERLPVGEFEVRQDPVRGRYVRRMSPVVERTTQLAAGSSAFVVNTQDHFELRLHRSDGAPLTTIVVNSAPVPMTQDLRRRYVEGPLSGIDNPELRSQLREQLESDPLPERLPAVGRVLMDSEDRIWVEGFALPDEPDATWWIFSLNGELIARGSLPRSTELDIHAISDRWIVGTTSGPLGIPVVELHSIERMGP